MPGAGVAPVSGRYPMRCRLWQSHGFTGNTRGVTAHPGYVKSYCLRASVVAEAGRTAAAGVGSEGGTGTEVQGHHRQRT